MQTKKRIQLFLLIISGVTLGLFLTLGRSTPTTLAAPPRQAPSQYEEIYEVLPDGSVSITRVPVSPQKTGIAAACTTPAPALLEPADGALLDTLIPDYVWEQVSNDVFRYKIEVSPSVDFSIIENSATFVISNPAAGEPATAFTRNNLAPGTTYHWRVASVCEDTGQTGPFSTAFSFISGSGGTILPAPSLLAPADGITTGSIRVAFGMSQVSGALKYQFRYFHSPTDDWDDWFRLRRSDDPLTTPTFDPQETIYWRGGAVNSYAVGTPSETRSFSTPAVTATTQIDAGGGTLTPDPGNISIQFPSGAVGNDTTLSYTLQPEPTEDLANFRFAGRTFTLEASDANGAVNTFDQPFTITINYDSFDLFAADIGDPSRLNLVFWNGSAWQEILPCAGCSVDTVNQTVTVVLDHLTEFALVAPAEQRLYLPIVLK